MELVIYNKQKVNTNKKKHKSVLSYQWGRHGSCLDMSPDEYYTWVDHLYRRVDLDGRLRAAGILPSDTRLYSMPSFMDAIKSAGRKEFEEIPWESIQLKLFRIQGFNYIIGVDICFENSQVRRYTTCPAQNPNAKPKFTDTIRYCET